MQKSTYRKKYIVKRFDIGGIKFLSKNILPLVHAEDLEIMKDIVRQTTTNEDGSGPITFREFGIIFDGTASFANAEVRNIKNYGTL